MLSYHKEMNKKNIPLTLTSSARDFEVTETVVSNPRKAPNALLLLMFITDDTGDCGDDNDDCGSDGDDDKRGEGYDDDDRDEDAYDDGNCVGSRCITPNMIMIKKRYYW